MAPYAPLDFSRYPDFTPAELPSGLIDPALADALQYYRHLVNAPVVIHDTVGTGHDPDGQHPQGKAADLHVVGVTLLDAWLAAERIHVLRGIGLYPWWLHPGLHLDVRDAPIRARWWRDRSGAYCPVTSRVLVDWIGHHAFVA